jgi:DNA repair protein RadC
MDATPMADKPHYWNHRERLRRRFLAAGASGLADYEALELLLTYSIPRKDVKPVAKALLKRFGSLAAVLDAPPDALAAEPGLGARSAALARLVKEFIEIYLKEKAQRKDLLSSPQAVRDYARAKLAGLPHEAVMVLYLNAKNELLAEDLLQEGTVDRVAVYPRRIVEGALKRHAAGLILVHNHPSGHPDPSEEDRRLTRSLQDAARALDLRVVDHVIVARAGCFSFAEEGLLEDGAPRTR